MTGYDVIVIGVGGMGALACRELARRGARVLGLEQFALGHSLGSSHGETRLYRRAYFESPQYVPLVTRALELWRELEAESGRTLAVETGLVLCGPPGSAVVSGARAAALAHELPFDRLDARHLGECFPELSVPPDWEIVVEPDAGFLRVEECVSVGIALARRAGAKLLPGTTVRELQQDGAGVRVWSDAGEFRAERAVVCPGAWASSLLGPLGRVLEVRRKVLLWLSADAAAHRLEAGAPAFGFDAPEGFVYGFPALAAGVVKLAMHSGGDVVTDPSQVDRSLRAEDTAWLPAVVGRHLPRMTAEVVRHRVCLYTMTPDEDFLLGPDPERPSVIVAAGFSGHGFKFASVIAEAVAGLALTGATAVGVRFLSPARFVESVAASE